MILSGGNFGGYMLTGNEVEFESTKFSVSYTESNVFFVTDESGQKWFYRIEESIVFIGINL